MRCFESKGKVFTWLAAGVIGVGSGSALAQFGEDRGLDDGQEPGAIEQEERIGVGAEERDEALVDPAAAEEQTITGTVYDAATYLIHGENGQRDWQRPLGGEDQQLDGMDHEREGIEQEGDLQQPQQDRGMQQQRGVGLGQQEQQSQVLVIVSDDGQAYLILKDDQDVQRPLGDDPLHQRDDAGLNGQERGQGQDAIDHQGGEAGVWGREGLQDHAADEDHVVDPAQEREPGLVQPERARAGDDVFKQLQGRIGEQVTLTGEVHERGGLRAIVVDEYGIEPAAADEPELLEPEQDDDADLMDHRDDEVERDVEGRDTLF